jgi:hypothetical protein
MSFHQGSDSEVRWEDTAVTSQTRDLSSGALRFQGRRQQVKGHFFLYIEKSDAVSYI